MIETLVEQAKSDAEVQKVLQPEMDRQQKAVAARRLVYDRVGAVLILSAILLIAWLTGFRPKHGAGAGLPSKLLRMIEKPPQRKPQRKQPGHVMSEA